MKTNWLATVTAFVLLTGAALAGSEQHPTDLSIAHADAAQAYQGEMDRQHAVAPQKAQALAQADGSGTNETMYRRRYASEQSGGDDGRAA